MESEETTFTILRKRTRTGGGAHSVCMTCQAVVGKKRGARNPKPRSPQSLRGDCLALLGSQAILLLNLCANPPLRPGLVSAFRLHMTETKHLVNVCFHRASTPV